MHILQVEDDAVMVDAVEHMLRAEGHSCQSTSLGEQAVRLSQSVHYDVILLDIMLPDIDGYEVMRLLRESGVRTPVVIQSGLVDRTNQADEPGFGVTEFLIKPFNRKELFERLETAISRSQKAGNSGSDPIGVQTQPARIVEPDRRHHRRFKSLKSGRIAHGAGIDCMILNMSHGGAAIRLPDENCDCPPKFALKVRAGTVYHCEVNWRYGDKLGVKFIQNQP
jgi:DNA-binding response OmpR family regulator